MLFRSNTETEAGGTRLYFGSCRERESVNDVFVVSFNMERSNPGKPSITIRVSARRSDAQEHANMGAQAVQTAIDSGDLRPADPESALENSASKLSDTLGEIVDFVFDKMDALAEVRTHMNKTLISFPEYSSTTSFTPTRISHGRHVRPYTG